MAGEAFILSDGDDVRFWDHARTVWRAAGVDVQPKDVIRMPAFFILLLAMIDEFIASIRGTTPKTSRSAVWFATRDYRFNINKARERLGYAPIVEYEEAVRRGVQVSRLVASAETIPLTGPCLLFNSGIWKTRRSQPPKNDASALAVARESCGYTTHVTLPCFRTDI